MEIKILKATRICEKRFWSPFSKILFNNSREFTFPSSISRQNLNDEPYSIGILALGALQRAMQWGPLRWPQQWGPGENCPGCFPPSCRRHCKQDPKYDLLLVIRVLWTAWYCHPVICFCPSWSTPLFVNMVTVVNWNQWILAFIDACTSVEVIELYIVEETSNIATFFSNSRYLWHSD